MGARWNNWSMFLIVTFLIIYIDTYTAAQNYPNPSCTKPCINGLCSGPELCSCKRGYIKNLTDTYTCVPYCKGGCPRPGKCMEPNKCECGNGYKLEKMACKIEYGSCVCEPGWKTYHSTGVCASCVPQCDPACGNGTCTGPNVCQCWTGYVSRASLNTSVEGPLCVPACINCDGTCVAPNKCICNPPYEARNVSANGDDCQCFSNCSESEKKCERTICELAKSDDWIQYWWIYVLVAIVILVTAALCITALIRKRKINNYNVNYDTQAASKPEDDFAMGEITSRSS